MSTEETPKSEASDAAENLESEMENRDEGRREDERAEQQDLNQGMDTGTHDSARHGVNWSPSYRTPSKRGKPNKVPKERKSNSD
jgi:hypothetical protein